MRTKIAATLTLFLLLVAFSAFQSSVSAQRGRGVASRPNVSTTPTPSGPKIETSGGPKSETKGPKRRIVTSTPTELVGEAVSTERKGGPAAPRASETGMQKVGGTGTSTTNSVSYVGVIAGVHGCPTGSDLVTFFTDDEDKNNANGNSGWVGGIIQNKNTLFKFCRVDGSKFSTPIDAPYAVLQLGQTCPAGSYSFSRYFDNEDYKNINSYNPSDSGQNWMRVLNSDAQFYFCVFSNNVNTFVGSPGSFPNLGVEYGVFAPSGLYGILEAGALRTDDEDGDNENSFNVPSGKQWETSMIISGDRNTDFKLAKVMSGPPMPKLHSVSMNVTSVEGGNNGRNPILTVALDGPAPPGGIRVDVSSSKPNIAWVMGSGYFMIPAGKTSEDWDYFLGTKNVISNKSLTLTVTVNGVEGYVNVDVTK